MIPMAEELYDANVAARQQDYEDRQLADYRIESAAIEAAVVSKVSEAETVTLGHLLRLKKMGKLTRRMARAQKLLEREAQDWAELDTDCGQ